ncbi:MAG: hypothetical protein ABI175_10775 [Polyangiales bacterium]
MSHYFVVFFALTACATDATTAPIPDGGGSGAASCAPQIPALGKGASVELQSSAAGNPQRDYCLTVPSGSSQVRLDLTGGTCGTHACIGDDVRMYLKAGAVPNAFDPDGTTTEWSYTPDPNGFGTYVKMAVPGPWYLSLLDNQNTLGYRSVKLVVAFP